MTNMVDFVVLSQTGVKPTSERGVPRAQRIIPILVPRYRGIVVYWYLGVEVYRCIDVFGGFRVVWGAKISIIWYLGE